MFFHCLRLKPYSSQWYSSPLVLNSQEFWSITLVRSLYKSFHNDFRISDNFFDILVPPKTPPILFPEFLFVLFSKTFDPLSIMEGNHQFSNSRDVGHDYTPYPFTRTTWTDISIPLKVFPTTSIVDRRTTNIILRSLSLFRYFHELFLFDPNTKTSKSRRGLSI